MATLAWLLSCPEVPPASHGRQACMGEMHISALCFLLPIYSTSFIAATMAFTMDSLSSEVKNPLNIALLVIFLYLLTPVVQAILPADPNKAVPTSHLEAYSWMPAKHADAILWKEYTPRSLRPFDGTNPDHSMPLLFAITGKVYDVSSGRSFYGPEGPYGEYMNAVLLADGIPDPSFTCRQLRRS